MKGRDGEKGKPGPILGKPSIRELRLLVQWTPDGTYWMKKNEAIGAHGESLESLMKCGPSRRLLVHRTLIFLIKTQNEHDVHKRSKRSSRKVAVIAMCIR